MGKQSCRAWQTPKTVFVLDMYVVPMAMAIAMAIIEADALYSIHLRLQTGALVTSVANRSGIAKLAHRQ